MPGVTLVGALDPPALLHDEAVARTRLGEFGVKGLLGAIVGEADKIARPLHRHLQFADLAEIALQAPPGLDRGLVITVIRAERIMEFRPAGEKARTDV